MRLVPETLNLVLHVVDRYLITPEVLKAELPLMGAAALLIAAKYKEIYLLLMYDLLGLVDPDTTYGAPGLLAVEEVVFPALDHRLIIPSA